MSDAIPALLAGNGVVLKPDAHTPFTALVAVELLSEAGLPRELFHVVTGPGPLLGPPLIEKVDYLMFTGSTATGRLIAEQCGRRLIGFSAELGGKNPMLVLADANLDKTVDGATRACFSNSGQLCISTERLYVEDAIYDQFVPAFINRVTSMRLGAGLTWDAEMGSLISQQQLDIVTRHVDDAVAKGARILAGGKARPDLGPLFYEPTILEGVTDDMDLAHHETFGPVVALHRVRDADHAIQRANHTRYGLNASIWSTPARGAQLATHIHAGTVNVNDGYSATWASYDAPMGGMKDSGTGRRHGREGILKYTQSQTIAVQRGIPSAQDPASHSALTPRSSPPPSKPSAESRGSNERAAECLLRPRTRSFREQQDQHSTLSRRRPFVVLGLIAIAFLKAFLPETKRYSLEELEERFAAGGAVT